MPAPTQVGPKRTVTLDGPSSSAASQKVPKSTVPSQGRTCKHPAWYTLHAQTVATSSQQHLPNRNARLRPHTNTSGGLSMVLHGKGCSMQNNCTSTWNPCKSARMREEVRRPNAYRGLLQRGLLPA